MPTQPIKLLEFKGSDWMKGLSLQTTDVINGIFQSATNFDPFKTPGFLDPNKSPLTAISGATITKTIKYMSGVNISGTDYFYGFAGNASNAAPALYRISSASATDVSSQITTTNSQARGLGVWRKKLIYIRDTEARSNDIPVASGSDVQVLASLNDCEHPSVVGADLYFYIGNGNTVAKLVTEGSTSSNSTNVFQIENGSFGTGSLTIRDLKNDGRYLIVIADNNPGTNNTGRYRCVVGFWDYVSGTFSQLYEIDDNRLYGCSIDGDAITVFGADNIYVCNSQTKPKPLYTFRGNASIAHPPASSSSIIKHQNSIFWGSDTATEVYGFGNIVPGNKKIFYNPSSGAGTGTPTCMASNGTDVFLATNTPAVFVFTSGSGNTCTAKTAPIHLKQPYKFNYVKVLAKEVLSSGNSISVQIQADVAKNILTSSTFSYSADGARRSKLLEAKPNSATIDVFENISFIEVTTNVAIEKIELWATPLPNQNNPY